MSLKCSIQGTKAIPQAYVVGIITSYQTYRETAIGPQTKWARIIFGENSGLTGVLPPDYNEDTIKAWQVPLSVQQLPVSPGLEERLR